MAATARRAGPSETAAPEDFQSLGVRPYIYVELPKSPGTKELPFNPPPGQSSTALGQHGSPSAPATLPSATLPSGMSVVGGPTLEVPHSLLEPSALPTTGPDEVDTQPLQKPHEPVAASNPRTRRTPSATHGPDSPLSPPRPPSRNSSPGRQRRRPKGRRRQALIVAAIAVAVAGFTSVLLIPDEPRRDTALEDGRTGAPEESGRTPASLSPSASASTEPSAAKRASSSASTSRSAPAALPAAARRSVDAAAEPADRGGPVTATG
ncbi:hypothetical protein ABZ904_49110, partial [Streptomyces sp. NPDC046900]